MAGQKPATFFFNKDNQMAKENLIYLTVGGNESYLKLLDLFLLSLIKTTNLDKIDICVFGQQSYFFNYASPLDKDIRFFHVNPILLNKTNKFVKIKSDDVYLNYDNMSHSVQKLRIHTLPEFLSYKKILYLDTDIILCKSANELFEKIDDKKVLHVCKDSCEFSDHNSLYYNHTIFADEIIERLINKKIYPFSGGIFGFIPSEVMGYHFKSVFNLIFKSFGDFFYEQSHMNHYFNKNCLTKDAFSEQVLTPQTATPFDADRTALVHYASSHVGVSQKIEALRAFYEKHTKL